MIENTKVLELSGTPFNLFDKYDEDNIFTWDYTMEQEAKYNWDKERPNEPNPYEGLPKVSMYTFDIAKTFNYVDETKAFNFKEFFRSENGKLTYEEDVIKFLNQITTEDSHTNYNCYVFDFAPDRALKIMSESIGLTSKKGKINTIEQKEKMAKMLNFFPIIGQSGNIMVEFSVDKMLTQLKKAYAEKAVRSGFEDNSLYNDNLLGLEEADLSDFKDLKAIVGTSNISNKDFNVVVAENGFSEEEHEKATKAERKTKKQRTVEEEEVIKKLQELRKQKMAMISILRGVSIRIPMMIYGMKVDLEEDISVEKFIKLVDNQSWEEFMPKGLLVTMIMKCLLKRDELFVTKRSLMIN